MEDGMDEPTLHSDWGYWDHLDGRELREGERVRVQWPDDTITEETIRIEARDREEMDHGHAVTIPDRWAYFVFTVVPGLPGRLYVRTAKTEDGRGLRMERV
jgi:hypothetical protein